jgi:hypothetical protein
MAVPTRVEGDLYVNGGLSSKTFTAPSGSITNAMVATNAAIAATKVAHQHRLVLSQSGTATSVTQPIYHCYGATGTTIAVYAGSIAIAVGAATVTVDVKKNGTTILSGVVTLNSSSVARIGQAGTITVPALVAGDVLEVVTVATAGGGTLPTGLFVAVTVNEDAA